MKILTSLILTIAICMQIDKHFPDVSDRMAYVIGASVFLVAFYVVGKIFKWEETK